MNDKIETDDDKIANKFNNFFTNIAKIIREKLPPTNKTFQNYLKRSVQSSLFFKPFHEKEIIKAISILDAKKASGPFNIPNRILQLIPKEISKILSKLFNISISTGKFISHLKIAKEILV